MEKITIRPATDADIPDLIRLRRMMFEDMGFDDPEKLGAADASVAAYLATALPAQQFQGWLAVTAAGVAVGSGGVVIDRHPPGPNNLSGQVGYIMNVVTDPRYRRRGIARRIMETMLEWLSGQGIQNLALHASEMGRPLYEQLGFEPSNEMRCQAEDQTSAGTRT